MNTQTRLHDTQAAFDSVAADYDGPRGNNIAIQTMRDEMWRWLARSFAPGSRLIDLGCGTGLCAPLLRPLARRLVGVDLSGLMLAKAREGGAYDELVQGDVAGVLAERAQGFDIAVAADVFVYIGDLDAVFAAATAALRPGGVFAFSVEACDDAHDSQLGPRRRYAHSQAYLRRLAAVHGLSVESTQRSVIRQESNEGVEGWLVVMRRS